MFVSLGVTPAIAVDAGNGEDVDPVPPFIRDFLYVDLSRVRSLLAQIAQGSPDSVTEQSQGAWNFAASLSAGPIGVSGGRSSGTGSAETRSLTDVHFALLEESAEALGLLTDVTELTQDSADWYGGRVHAELEEGQLVRVSGPVRLVDSSYIESSLERIDRMLDGWADVLMVNSQLAGSSSPPAPTKRTGGNSQQRAGGGNRADRDRTRAQFKREHLGAAPEMFAALRQLIGSLLEDGISFRAMPAGEDQPNCSFTGTLLDRSEYIEPERGAIFSRLGLKPTRWTIVGIVSRFAPTTIEELSIPSDDFTRANLEILTTSLLDRIEGLGLSSAPSWPGISVIPVAVYRALPTKPDT